MRSVLTGYCAELAGRNIGVSVSSIQQVAFELTSTPQWRQSRDRVSPTPQIPVEPALHQFMPWPQRRLRYAIPQKTKPPHKA